MHKLDLLKGLRQVGSRNGEGLLSWDGECILSNREAPFPGSHRWHDAC